jgi:RNA polymerase sigma factor (sigma-70 family)
VACGSVPFNSTIKRGNRFVRRRKSILRKLYEEFQGFYTRHRCRWAPANPRRIFNLCFRSLYPQFNRRITPYGLMAVVYEVLGVRRAEPRGLFQTFDPAKYKGSLPLEDHFVNLFTKRLRGKLSKACVPASDSGREADPARFRARPEIGLHKEGGMADRDRELVESVPEALACLEKQERLVIHLNYWVDLSGRQIAAVLGIDHKTVRGRHDRAIRKLRRFYGETG